MPGGAQMLTACPARTAFRIPRPLHRTPPRPPRPHPPPLPPALTTATAHGVSLGGCVAKSVGESWRVTLPDSGKCLPVRLQHALQALGTARARAAPPRSTHSRTPAPPANPPSTPICATRTSSPPMRPLSMGLYSSPSSWCTIRTSRSSSAHLARGKSFGRRVKRAGGVGGRGRWRGR